jgi:hypothetical protein
VTTNWPLDWIASGPAESSNWPGSRTWPSVPKLVSKAPVGVSWPTAISYSVEVAVPGTTVVSKSMAPLDWMARPASPGVTKSSTG